MLASLLECINDISIGKILIQRDENTAEPIYYYKKLPNLLNKDIIILDPMLGITNILKTIIYL